MGVNESESESLREHTWRERQEAKAAAETALAELKKAQDAAQAAQQRYWDALSANDEAVQANVAAWHG